MAVNTVEALAAEATPWLQSPSGGSKPPVIEGPLPTGVHAVLRQRLFVQKADLPSPLLNQFKRLTVTEIYGALAGDSARNDLILNDVIRAVADGRSPMLLTERRDHLEYMAERTIVLDEGPGA